MSKIVIIDGNSLLFRAFYATSFKGGPLLATSYGTPTNAIVAFSNMLANIMKTLKDGDGIFVAFDKGKNTFRHQEFKDYKANRKPAPEELHLQMPIARELLKSLNIAYYEDDNIEADDIAGIMAKAASKGGYKVEIYTSDHDYLQLIDKNITIELIRKGLTDINELNLETFNTQYGIKPIQITDYKGLLGDVSDNIPGIPKIGEKTALELIKKYGDLENIINAALTGKSKVDESIVIYQDTGRLSKRLATIHINDPISFTVSETLYKGYKLQDISEFANRYELTKLISRLPQNLMIKDEKTKIITFEEITSTKDLDLTDGFGIALDSENINYHDANIFGISICIKNKVYYLDKRALLTDSKLLDALKNKSIKKYAFDYKAIVCTLKHNNIDIDGLYFDLLLSSYLLNSDTKTDFASIMKFYNIDVQDAYITDNALLVSNNPKLSAYIAYYSINMFSDIVFKLKEKDQYDLLYSIEQPLTLVLTKMEIEGFPVDKETLLNFKKEYELKVHDLENQIYALAGEEFNISSPKQLSKILYDKLKLVGNKNNSTSVDYLKELKDVHPIIPLILDYRKYSKLISQYVDGIVCYIHNDGKIHASFNQAITTTGRLSSSEPNLQNISVRDEDAKQIRKAFYYPDNKLGILSLDYSQIELRILAHLSNSKTLIDIFESGHDIHSETAKKVFHLDREPTSLERRKAKAVNFGIIYGISDWGLADQIESSVSEAREIITNFYEEFPEIKTYLDGLVEFAKTHGYATTMFNRRRYLDELNDSNYQVREFAKRAAMNAPIQGSAADLIKIAMIKIDDALIKGNYRSCLISQIHDELILKVYDEEEKKVQALVSSIMENCVKLKVHLKVDGGYAKTWFDAK